MWHLRHGALAALLLCAIGITVWIRTDAQDPVPMPVASPVLVQPWQPPRPNIPDPGWKDPWIRSLPLTLQAQLAMGWDYDIPATCQNADTVFVGTVNRMTTVPHETIMGGVPITEVEFAVGRTLLGRAAATRTIPFPGGTSPGTSDTTIFTGRLRLPSVGDKYVIGVNVRNSPAKNRAVLWGVASLPVDFDIGSLPPDPVLSAAYIEVCARRQKEKPAARYDF